MQPLVGVVSQQEVLGCYAGSLLQQQCIQPSMIACAASVAATPKALADVLGYESSCECEPVSWAALHACSIRQRWDPVTGRTTQGSVSIKKEKEREERARQEALQEGAVLGNAPTCIVISVLCCLPRIPTLHATVPWALRKYAAESCMLRVAYN